MSKRSIVRVASLAVLTAVGGCFATRSDVRVVQTDLATLRTEMVRSDAQLRSDLAAASALIKTASDSIDRLSARTASIQGDVRGESRAIREQLLQIQTLLGQSQANISRIRAEMEARTNAMPVAPPPTFPPGTSIPLVRDTSVVPVQVGPNQLYTNGRDQLQRGSNSTARMLFQQLLRDYPGYDQAADAQYYIADSYEREKNYPAADAAYAAVVQTYPSHSKAPTALYKRALLFNEQKNTREAINLLEQVISRYPQSTEAQLSADRLKTIRPGF